MKRQQGITLIALVITIIVMLILVGVTITLVLNGGLIDKAKEAANGMNAAVASENALDFDFNNLPSGSSGSGEQGGATTITWTYEDANTNSTLNVGELVTASNGEEFFYIGTSNNKALLLSKYNLNSAGTAQDKDGHNNGRVFCTSDQWTTADAENAASLSDLNSLFSGVSGTAVAIAEAYGSSLGATGRLMLYSEANTLKSSNSTICYGYAQGHELSYWLGTHGDDDVVMSVGEWNNEDNINDLSYYSSSSFGVRPVVMVSASIELAD